MMCDSQPAARHKLHKDGRTTLERKSRDLTRTHGMRSRAAVAWLCWLFPMLAQGQGAFTELLVVGDSLSDMGNAAAARDSFLGQSALPAYTIGLCNPADALPSGEAKCEALIYEKSRVSDGPVAVERLAQGLALGARFRSSWHVVPSRPLVGSNYAVASAKARGQGVEDLWAQVDALLLDHADPRLPDGALYVVAIGANDVVDALQTLDDSRPIEAFRAIIDTATNAIAVNVERLIDSGARHVLVINVPNVGDVPALRDAVDGDVLRALASTIADLAARRFNAQLWRRLSEVQRRHPSAEIGVFDLYTVFQLIIEIAPFYGINVTDACFDSHTYFDSTTAERVFHERCAPEPEMRPKFDRFMFWDQLHPTGWVHALIGDVLTDAALSMAPL